MEPSCQQCGTAFLSVEEGGIDRICIACLNHAPLWDKGSASFYYNEGISRLILPLKYADTQRGLDFLVNAIWHKSASYFQGMDYIIPVPLHKKRLRQRKYNQSALLAWKLSKLSNIEALPVALKRCKHTSPLGHFNRKERQAVLANAFQVNEFFRNRLINKKVILIDDVMTTGATLSACSRVLREIGVNSIHIIVIAKTHQENISGKEN